MRDVPNAMVQTWLSGDYTGPQRPMCRVTVQQMGTKLYNHSFPIMPATQEEVARRHGNALATVVEPAQSKAKKTGETTYASTIFGSEDVPMELPNLRSVSWSRSTDQDAAQATFEFYNSRVVLEGIRDTPDGPERMVPVRDEMGFYTFDRGDQLFSNRWGHEQNDWFKRLVPDNILRTYEGYGYNPDPDVKPERDRNLVQTGVWIIDQVDYSDGAIIKVTCRDMARLLMDHISFVPVIPADFYPLTFQWIKDREVGDVPERTYRAEITVKNEEAIDVGVVTDPNALPARLKATAIKYRASSDAAYGTGYINYRVVKGDYLIKIARKFGVPRWRDIYDLNEDKFEQRGTGENYKPKSPHWIYPGQVFKIPTVEPAMRGHEPSDAFDASSGTYWLSHGFEQGNKAYSMNWIEGTLGKVPLAELRVTPKGYGYNIYVSVRSRGKWINKGRIPYRKPANGTDLDADIPYAKMISVSKAQAGKEIRISLGTAYPQVDRVRLTFSNMPVLAGRHRVGLHRVRAFTDARYNDKGKLIPLPTKPGVRGIDDSFNRTLTYSTKPGAKRGLGKTPQKDEWSAGNYEISPKGTARRARFSGKHEQDHDNGLASFVPATVELGIHDQVVTLHTNQNTTSKDVFPDGKWLIALRADKTGTKTGIWIFIDYDGEITVYSVTPDPDNPKNKLGEYIGGTYGWTDVATNPEHDYNKTPREITAALIGNDLVITDRPVGSTDQAPIRYSKNHARFAKHTGTRAGFGLGNYSSNISRFISRTRYRRGVTDTFRRADDTKLGRADTGQTWRHAKGAYAVANRKGLMVANPLNHLRPAIIDMHDSDQDVRLTLDALGSENTVAILLRAADSDNCIRVRLEADRSRILIELRIDGVNARLDEDDIQPDGTIVEDHDPVIIPVTVPTGRPLKFRAKLIENTLSIYLGDQDEWAEVPRVWTDSRTAFTQDELAYHCGFGARGTGLQLREFRGISLGAEDTWTFWSETVVPAHFEPGAGTKPGTYDDYTDIVKLFCAWGGLYWPLDAANVYSDETVNAIRPAKSDYVLGMKGEVGRVWGDFELSGTGGPTPYGPGQWDKRTLMDNINFIRDILNFLFYVDELGGVVWRQPNIFHIGNNVSSFSSDPRRTDYMYEIDEKRTLLSLDTSLNSRNIRERNVVADATSQFAALSVGWNPNDTGLRRIRLITDLPFQNQEESQVMADMITVRQAFRYRTSSVTIPAMPAIQIDDQIRIYEEVANEGHLHYVSGVESSNNLETGEWTYNLSVFWLGEDPLEPEKWAFDASTLAEETQDYIEALKLRTGVGTTNYYELPRKDTATGTPPTGPVDTEGEVISP